MLSGVFIRRPRLAIVLSLLIAIAGGLALMRLPVAQYPSIAPPTVQVFTAYAGANAETVEATIAQPVEAAVNGVPGMKYIRSTSGADGSYALTVSFEIGTDPELAAVAVQDRIASVLPRMPAEVRQVGLTVTKASGDLLQVFALYSPDDLHDELEISNHITLNMLDDIARVPGVGDANIFGQRDYAMRVWLNPDRLTQLELTSEDVVAAIAAQNRQAAAGSIGVPPVPSSQMVEMSISTRGRLASVEEFEDIVLRADLEGGFVRLSDVARIELDAASVSSVARYKGHEAAAIGIYLAPGANAVLVAKAVAARMEELAQSLPSGMAYDVVLNNADFVDAMIDTVVETLLIAFALVALVVFVFLGRFRAALIPLLAVPVSIIGALGFLYAVGFSANAITLLALVLAIGIVVDDAIIVTENVERVMEENPSLTPAQAAVEAMREITPSVVAITLVLLSVFVPAAFLPGSSGVLFQQFAAAVSGAVVISALVALTLSPALAAMILKPGPPLLVMRVFTWAVDKFTFLYTVLVRVLLWVAVAGLAGVLVAGWGSKLLLDELPKGFVPPEDKGFLYTIMSLPAGASLERTDAAAREAEAIIARDPAVDSVATILGLDFLAGGSASNGGVFFVKLKPYANRQLPELSAFATVGRLRTALAGVAEALFIPANPPAISGLGRIGGLEYVLQARQGQSLEELTAVGLGLSQAAGAMPEVAGMYGASGNATPRVRLDIDRDFAQELGVSLPSVFSTLQTMLGGTYVNDFNLFGRSWTVRVQADGASRREIADILALNVRSVNGALIPISTFATAEVELGPRSITRYDNYRALTLTAASAPGVGSGRAITALEAVSSEKLPNGYGYEWTGQALEETQSGGQTLAVIGLAFLFAYLFLVALYESWSIPVSVLLSVPVAVAGALYAVRLSGLSFDVYAQIGIVVLIALAAKNAILMNSFAVQLREAGRPPRQAAAEAARLRFRPVMMTSVAFVAGLVPLAIATGPGAAAMRAVGTPVLGGMAAASTAGIFAIPMLFLVVQWFRERLG